MQRRTKLIHNRSRSLRQIKLHAPEFHAAYAKRNFHGTLPTDSTQLAGSSYHYNLRSSVWFSRSKNENSATAMSSQSRWPQRSPVRQSHAAADERPLTNRRPPRCRTEMRAMPPGAASETHAIARQPALVLSWRSTGTRKQDQEVFPNPHAPPHLPAGEAQFCAECHHVHRPSEVSCTSCHREFNFNQK